MTYVRSALKVTLAWMPFWAIYALVGVVHAGLPTGETVFISTSAATRTPSRGM